MPHTPAIPTYRNPDIGGAIPRAAAIMVAFSVLAVFSAGNASAASVTSSPDATACAARVSANADAGGYFPTYLKTQLARSRAVSKWRATVNDLHGSNFAVWRRATDKRVRCDTALGKAYCVAEANPCRSGSIAGFTF